MDKFVKILITVEDANFFTTDENKGHHPDCLGFRPKIISGQKVGINVVEKLRAGFYYKLPARQAEKLISLNYAKEVDENGNDKSR